MLSLEKVKNGLETFGYEYANNILCGHTKSKVKWALPTGIVNVMAFEQATSYLFGFSDNGINLFPVHGDWDIADNLFIPWSEITSFKMKNGLLAVCGIETVVFGITEVLYLKVRRCFE